MGDYDSALAAAGARIICFESFGSYQGDWWAKVEYKGETGWVQGSFGSCSGCDAFEAEFGWRYNGCGDHEYDPQDTCTECQAGRRAYEEKLADFGRTYLGGLMTQAAAEAEAGRNAEWDGTGMLNYVKEHA